MRLKTAMCVFVTMLATLTLGIACSAKDASANTSLYAKETVLHSATHKNPYNGDLFSKNKTPSAGNQFRTNYIQVNSAIKDVLSSRGQIVNLSNGTELVLKNNKIMVAYKNNFDATNEYIEVLNMYSRMLSGKHNIYAMLIPTQIEFDTSKFKRLSDSQKDNIDYIYASLDNITTVNVYDALKSHSKEYLYFKTDHHWTQRGGYYGYKAFIEAKGENAVPIEVMKRNTISGFQGYLYNETKAPHFDNIFDEIEYFDLGENYPVTIKGVENGKEFEYQKHIYSVPQNIDDADYGVFMDGDHQYAEINTNIKNGKVALVIKDSYANAVIPFLTMHYEKIMVVDPRSYTGSVTALTNECHVDDIIFINNATVPTLELFIENMAGIL